MKRILKSLLASVMLLQSFVAMADAPACECVQALNGDRFLVAAPSGWRLDNKTLADRGVLMLFSRIDQPFDGVVKENTVYMYVLPTAKSLAKSSDADDVPSVQGLIARRVEQIQNFDGTAKGGKRGFTLRPERNPTHSITFADYEMPRRPLFETVAYVEDERTIWAIILAAASQDLLDQNTLALWHVIKNYSVEQSK